VLAAVRADVELVAARAVAFGHLGISLLGFD
jgi:hypothetical protein